jgi:hypothetical protein
LGEAGGSGSGKFFYRIAFPSAGRGGVFKLMRNQQGDNPIHA